MKFPGQDAGRGILFCKDKVKKLRGSNKDGKGVENEMKIARTWVDRMTKRRFMSVFDDFYRIFCLFRTRFPMLSPCDYYLIVLRLGINRPTIST